MKRLITVALVLAVTLTAFTALPPVKTYTLILDEQQVNSLLIVIDKSEAPHTTVSALQKEVIQQLQVQLNTAALQDSLQKKDSAHSKPKK